MPTIVQIAYQSNKNQDRWRHSEHTKQLALLFAQSRLKNVATEVLS